MKNMIQLFSYLLFGIAVAACAGTKELSQEEIRLQYPTISNLEQEVASARSNSVDRYAPEGFAAAADQLSAAYGAGRFDQRAVAEEAVRLGLTAIDKANKDAERTRDILAEVIQARAKAIEAGATDMFPGEYKLLEREFGDTANLIERNVVEKAKQIRPRLRQEYSNLELRALREGTAQRGEIALERARNNDAQRLAPKTYKAAQESLALATSLLTANREDRDRAQASARRAASLADRSSNIAELIKDFRRRDFEEEDIVLWYQEQIAMIAQTLSLNPEFNETNKATIASINNAIGALIDDSKQLAAIKRNLSETDAAMVAQQKRHADEIAKLKQEAAGEQAQLTAAQHERDRKFDSVQMMFSSAEANVYRQQDNVLISVHGVRFPIGSSEIEPRSFGLMNKITRSIKIFDNPTVQVVGHTDATGSAIANRSLSEERAKSVARFLTDVGGYPAYRIKSEGVGADRPIATNATPEGRAQNRRIDVLIINRPIR